MGSKQYEHLLCNTNDLNTVRKMLDFFYLTYAKVMEIASPNEVS